MSCFFSSLLLDRSFQPPGVYFFVLGSKMDLFDTCLRKMGLFFNDCLWPFRSFVFHAFLFHCIIFTHIHACMIPCVLPLVLAFLFLPGFVLTFGTSARVYNSFLRLSLRPRSAIHLACGVFWPSLSTFSDVFASV